MFQLLDLFSFFTPSRFEGLYDFQYGQHLPKKQTYSCLSEGLFAFCLSSFASADLAQHFSCASYRYIPFLRIIIYRQTSKASKKVVKFVSIKTKSDLMLCMTTIITFGRFGPQLAVKNRQAIILIRFISFTSLLGPRVYKDQQCNFDICEVCYTNLPLHHELVPFKMSKAVINHPISF